LIVARGLGLPKSGAIVAFGLGLGGTTIVVPTPPHGGGTGYIDHGRRERERLERMRRIARDDTEVLEFLTLFLHAVSETQ